MNGVNFYNFLLEKLKVNQPLGERYTFNKWLKKRNSTASLQFIILPDKKINSIPMHIIISAKDAYNNGIDIDEDWFKYYGCNRGIYPPKVMNWLLKNYQ